MQRSTRQSRQQAARQQLLRKVGTLKGLARQLRTDPTPWTEDGKIEVSLLQELDDSVREAQALLDSDTVPEWAQLSFEARFEQLVRQTFRRFAAAEAEQERQELERSMLDLDHEGDDTSDWYEDDEG